MNRFEQDQVAGLQSTTFSLDGNIAADDNRGLDEVAAERVKAIMADDAVDFDNARLRMVREKLLAIGADPDTGLPLDTKAVTSLGKPKPKSIAVEHRRVFEEAQRRYMRRKLEQDAANAEAAEALRRLEDASRSQSQSESDFEEPLTPKVDAHERAEELGVPQISRNRHKSAADPVTELMVMGFRRDEAVLALSKSQNDVQRAVELLLKPESDNTSEEDLLVFTTPAPQLQQPRQSVICWHCRGINLTPSYFLPGSGARMTCLVCSAIIIAP